MKKSPSKISTKYTTNTTRPEEKPAKLFSVRQRFLMDCGFVVPRSLSSPRMHLLAEFRKNIQVQTKLLLDSFSDERSRK